MERKERRQLLRRFQCDYNRRLEETFAKTFAEDERLRLFFINEDRAFTDGQNIVVDPAMDDLFADQLLLRAAEQRLHWPAIASANAWDALRLLTRAQTIHECLHILYTDFPLPAAGDARSSTQNRKKVLALIDNIIEDAYIEAAGCSVYDDLEMYLRFLRTAKALYDRCYEARNGRQKLPALAAYFNYMISLLLYPLGPPARPPLRVRRYVRRTQALFWQGSAAPAPAQRHAFAQQIFDIIAPLIPPDGKPLGCEAPLRRLYGSKTHDSTGTSIADTKRRGAQAQVHMRLFTWGDGRPREGADVGGRLKALQAQYARERQAALCILTQEGTSKTYTGQELAAGALHKGIRVIENHPKVDGRLRRAYQNIVEAYRSSIHAYSGRIFALLQARVPVREERLPFGSGISSKHLADVKRRYWYRLAPGTDVPELAVLLLIDGSGSMQGAQRESAVQACVILHEVLKKQGILHAIVEHRAHGYLPEMECNILVGFEGREEEKYNLLRIAAEGDNRDGLALYWAQRYLAACPEGRERLMIVVSDGLPSHAAGGYHPPISTRDTALAVRKLQHGGTTVIAVALDDADTFACYDQLRGIYPNIVACTDLARLPGQLLALIAKQLR